MIPVLVATLGVVALVGGGLLLRSLGPRYRVGRLLAVVPRISVDDAVAHARAGHAPYVRVDGRIDAEEEFEDADHRPLVFRRTRIHVERTGGWSVVEDGLETIPFEVREGLTGIAIDGAALSDGLVVVRRESRGHARDLPDRVPGDAAPDAPIRVTIEQLSSVDHVSALGVPALDADGNPRLGPGRGRPLIVTNLEPAEAMRILVGDRRFVPPAAAGALAGGAILIVLAIALGVSGVG